MAYLRYNLQFFAKDGPGGEKTEPATAKKLEDARKDGSVPKSREIVTSVSMLVSFFFLKIYLGSIGNSLMDEYVRIYNKISTLASPYNDEININTAMALMSETLINILLVIAPIMLLMFAIAFIGDFVQFKWKVTTKPLQPKLDKISPLKGFKRIFSKQSLVNFLKSAALVCIIGYILYGEISDLNGFVLGMYDVSLPAAIGLIGEKALDLAIKISFVYVIVGVIDLIWQRHKFKEDMKMTKQEIKDEMKNAEGNPQIKSQIRRKMLQVSQRRMMQSVPEADVVITNPTHFAVAIKYDPDKARAPIVVAKGEDYLAQKIKQTAKENNVEIVENKPLARALYANVDIGMEIPEELYQTVAEILAMVYRLKGKTR
ncbi:MAG: flagellar biosynthesis protein FlhB [Lachnospiraceae bacterium]|nr:flagellar biosynthesis protein FlhB [Lachnospiraceae bacterium]